MSFFPKSVYLKYQKWQACGNDFIITQNRPLSSETVKRLCARHTGIGADGIIFCCLTYGFTKDYEAEIVIKNADGSVAEMCGNGIRCVGEYVRDFIGWWSEMNIKTAAGIKHLHFYKRRKKIAVEMGKVEYMWDRGMEVEGKKYEGHAILVGNPHCVIFKAAEPGEVERYGSKLERNEVFSNGANIEFADVQSRDRIRMKVWERGVGRTLACGTGACASAYAAYKNGLTNERVTVELDGGEVEVKIKGDEVTLMGPAEYVGSGELWCTDGELEDDFYLL